MHLNAQEWQVWEFVNGQVSLEKIAQQLRISVITVQQIAFRLIVVGLAEEFFIVAHPPITVMEVEETKPIGCSEPTQKAALRENAVWGLEIALEIADHFYAYLGREPEMNAILNEKAGRIHRLRETFVQWFHEIFTGIDAWESSYAQRRWRIGIVQVQIGIEPQHVVPAMVVVVHEVGRKLKANSKSDELKDALAKICMIDLDFIEQAYVEATANTALKETGWSESLFKRLISHGAAAM